MTQAFGSTEIAVRPRRLFEESWQRYPEISRELCRLLCKRSRNLFKNFEAASLIPLSSRIANQLCELARSLGSPCPGGIHFDMRITQEDIGFMVGSSRQSVNKVLKVWQTQGIIKIDYGTVLIRNMDQLSTLTMTLDHRPG